MVDTLVPTGRWGPACRLFGKWRTLASCNIHCICRSGLQLSASGTLCRIARPVDRTEDFNGSG
ncbi:hypothetical protein L207DRAFT_507032 [Hyaloscypha variabilis F]|uniref:Uncharacterized protein n=1 Tax=Hyaloscypha variabilis (strain UAMH 11265 / GT02V1 / F) TaxID=1149755 RepID=A0A2J6S5R4_HYAVF|nr:hypothetical protein L207DRAFT_507032 [Hyaloscypha variabilis F]